METFYPEGPAEVPAAFTRPTSAYKRQAWIAVGALLLFITLYLALTAWFVITGIDQLARIGGERGFVAMIVGVCSLFLAFFMIKALFFIKKGSHSGGMEVNREEQPRLFEFLNRIADETGAPRPHKVFLSGRVNAAVFYDLSLINLLFPSRKNLEIGLGLVNMLNLGEFKAVCAHEFGHFAQRSMAVGRWVYTTQQIAAHIVGKRDALDGFLRRLSRSDVRVAWVGWLLGVVIWALRAVVDAVFRLVVLAQRALSREMEMQADLVAVSVSGSDALVHALHRLKVADDAWDRSLNFLRGEVAAKKPPHDVFAVQYALADRLSVIYNDPKYTERPTIPASDAAAFRVFNSELAQPPRMWSTHPMNYERENNAKRTYLFAPMDERSAWAVFDNAEDLRSRMTRELAANPEIPAVLPTETMARLDDQFAREHLKPQYRGIYLGFSPTRQSDRVDDLHEPVSVTAPIDAAALYPASLNDELEQLRSLEREHALLCALRDRTYDAPDGVIRHRGKIIKHSQLPAAIMLVDGERKAVRKGIETALKRVRSLHLSAARRISPEWHDYLCGVLKVLHYADHAEANVRDAQASLARIWQRATARGHIDERGARQIVAGAGDVHRTLSPVFLRAANVQPGARILGRLGIANWAPALGAYKLNAPTRSNINDWLRHIDAYVNHATAWLSSLRRAALDELLEVEGMVAAATHGVRPSEAPATQLAVPAEFDTLKTGTERGQRETVDFWHKFQTANGFFPGLLRAAVSIAIVGSVLVFGWVAERRSITVYNPLQRKVVVTVDGHRLPLFPLQNANVSVNAVGEVHVTTQAEDGTPIESFTEYVSPGEGHIVYTVAAAAPLKAWTAAYGYATASPPRLLTPDRWQDVRADDLFTVPPRSIQTQTGSGTRSVIDALGDMAPESYIGALSDPKATSAMELAHVRYDAPDSPYLVNWLALARQDPGLKSAVQARLVEFPKDVAALRAEQDVTTGAEHAAACTRDRVAAAAAPNDADLAYLAVRCEPEGAQRNQHFVDGARRWPDSSWFAYAGAASEADRGEYLAAIDDYVRAMNVSPSLRATAADLTFRLQRLINPQVASQYQAQYASWSSSLRQMLAFEPDQAIPAQKPDRAFALLSHGEINEAVTDAAGTPMAAHVLRMAAASKGASAQLREQAQALPSNQGIDSYDVLLALAQGADAHDPVVASLLAQMDKGYGMPLSEKVEQFLELCRGGNPAQAEHALDGLPFIVRAQAYVAGSYLLQQRTPDAWRTFAARVLLAGERPYLG
jgi:Zn-dependent protease with chaperone function